MMKRLLCAVLCTTLAAAVLSACGNTQQPAPAPSSSAPASSAVSTESREESIEKSQPESKPEESSEPSPAPDKKHGQKLTDISCKMRTDMEIAGLITKIRSELTDVQFYDDLSLYGTERVTAKKIELSFPLGASEVSGIIRRFIGLESYNLFIDNLSLTAEGDDFRCELVLYHPYPKDEAETADKEIQSYIKNRFRAVDRSKMMDAFLSIHQNYRTQTVTCRFVPDRDDRVDIGVQFNFGSYSGYNRYMHQVANSEAFEAEVSEYSSAESDDGEVVYHAEVTLHTTKFTL